LLTVAVSVGSGALAIINLVIIVVVVTCCRRRNRRKEERDDCNDNGARSIELDEDDRYYSTIGLPVAEANNNADAYCRPLPAEPEENKEYSALAEPEPEPTNNDNNTPYYLSLKG